MSGPYAHLFSDASPSPTPRKKKDDPYSTLYGEVAKPRDVDAAPKVASRQPFVAEEPPVLPGRSVAAGAFGYTPHGTTGSWDDETPGVVEQFKGGAAGAYEAVRHPVQTLKGMVTHAVDDAAVVGALAPWANKAPLAGKTRGDIARAGVNTAANVALLMAGPAGWAALPEVRLALNATLGAINDPEQPVRGATAGLLAGEVIHGTGKAVGRFRPRGKVVTEPVPVPEPVRAPVARPKAPTIANVGESPAETATSWTKEATGLGTGTPGISREVDGRQTRFVARDADGNPVGTLLLHKNSFGDEVVRDVHVDPSVRRQGIATQLYNAARDAGHDIEAALRVSPKTTQGQAFAQSVGAVPAAPVSVPPATVATPAPASTVGGIPGASGRAGKAILRTGDALPVEYRIVSRADVQPSHDPFSFAPNPAYPEGVQGRDYLRNKGIQSAVARRTFEFSPDIALNPSEMLSEGVPTVLPNGTVVAGNERAMLLARTALHAPERHADYVAQLKARAPDYGIDPATVDQVRDPMLVRVLTDPAEAAAGPARWAEVNRLSDEVATKGKSTVEEGAARATALMQKPEALAHLGDTLDPNSTVNEYLGTADGRTFVRQLVRDGVIRADELSRYTDAGGALTQEGRTAVRHMLLSTAVTRPAVVLDAPPAVLQKLEHAIPSIVSTRGTKFDITSLTTEALAMLGEARDHGVTVRDLAAQHGLFGDVQRSPLATQLATFLDESKAGSIKAAYRKFGTLAKEATAGEGIENMFGPSEFQTIPDIFHASFGGTPIAEAPAALVPPVERVLNAVTKYGGKEYDAPTHAQTFDAIRQEVGKVNFDRVDDNYFRTSTGRVVTREQAFQIAEQAEQGRDMTRGGRGREKQLFAEALPEIRAQLPRVAPAAQPIAPGAPPEPAAAVAQLPTAPEPFAAATRPPEAAATELSPLAAAGIEERNIGISLSKKMRDKIRTAYRSAIVTPYAAAEAEAPGLVEAMHKGGAAEKRAQDVASYRLDRLFDGLTETQQQQFGRRLLLDQYEAEAVRKQAVDPAVAQRFTDLANDLRPTVPAGIEQQPWFQERLALYKSSIETPLTKAAIQAGVNPADLRPTQLAYLKLVSERRLEDAEIRRALDVANVTDIADLQRRPALFRKLFGENPALRRYFVERAQGPRAGPLAANAGGAPVGYGAPGPRTQTTSSARMAAGTAEAYSPDLRRILALDTREKFLKAANNEVLQQIATTGRKLEPGELAAPGKRVLAFDQKNVVLIPEDAEPIAMTTAKRYEVSPAVHDAVRTYFERQRPAPQSVARRMVQRAADLATRAQIAGMPVEATSHANTLASLVSKVPGEKDVLGSVIAAIPGIGSKAASIREMLGVNFKDPATIALRDRLADIGALRVEEVPGGLVNTSHKWLFGPEGVDPRARLVLARKYLARDPNATDAALREFITSQAGNYNAANSAALPNFMAKGSVLSPFARFQAARIPTSIKRTLGESSLPTTSRAQRIGDVAQTLYRGPLGFVLGTQLANMALSGHSTQENDPGHALDVNTGLYAVPGGIERMTPEEANARYGDKAAPIYVPAATADPVTYAGLRSTGLRAALPWLSPEQPNVLRPDNVVRDVANVAFGTTGPFVRAGLTMLTGTQPFLQSDNSFLRVAPRRFGSDIGGRVATAFGLANPAVHAFTASGGDASRTLAGAMAEDDRWLGGPASIAARVAEFTMPRVLAPAIGGKTNEQSADAQLDRRFREAMLEYTSRIRRAPGPAAQRQIIEEATADARRAGFDPDVVEAALDKASAVDNQAYADKQKRQAERRVEKIRKK